MHARLSSNMPMGIGIMGISGSKSSDCVLSQYYHVWLQRSLHVCLFGLSGNSDLRCLRLESLSQCQGSSCDSSRCGYANIVSTYVHVDVHFTSLSILCILMESSIRTNNRWKYVSDREVGGRRPSSIFLLGPKCWIWINGTVHAGNLPIVFSLRDSCVGICVAVEKFSCLSMWHQKKQSFKVRAFKLLFAMPNEYQ